MLSFETPECRVHILLSSTRHFYPPFWTRHDVPLWRLWSDVSAHWWLWEHSSSPDSKNTRKIRENYSKNTRGLTTCTVSNKSKNTKKMRENYMINIYDSNKCVASDKSKNTGKIREKYIKTSRGLTAWVLSDNSKNTKKIRENYIKNTCGLPTWVVPTWVT